MWIRLVILYKKDYHVTSRNEKFQFDPSAFKFSDGINNYDTVEAIHKIDVLTSEKLCKFRLRGAHMLKMAYMVA